MTDKQKLIQVALDEYDKTTGEKTPPKQEGWFYSDEFVEWFIETKETKIKQLEDELSDEIKMHSLVIAENKALQASIDDAPQLYMPKEHLEYAKTKRFPSINFFATRPPDGKREYIAVALVIKKEE